MFFLCFFFTDLCQTNYLKIYQTDVHQICIFGRTMAVDGPFELVLRSQLIQRTKFSHKIEFLSFGDIRQMAVAYDNRSSAVVVCKSLPSLDAGG